MNENDNTNEIIPDIPKQKLEQIIPDIPKQKLEHIADNQDLIAGNLCAHGQYCIIGELLHRAGFTDVELTNMPQGVVDSSEVWKRALSKLRSVFGLNVTQVRKLMRANDKYQKLSYRRTELKSAIKEL